MKKETWNGICFCGHDHESHTVIPFNPNYTRGHCTKCKECLHFNHDPKITTPNMEHTKERIAQIIGEASMLWSETPTGVFNSEKAENLVDEIMAHIEYPIIHPDDVKPLT